MNKIKNIDYTKGFHFIPMGGSEEFGINFNLYCCDGKWVIFDCGIGFADERHPGVDILLPDPSFIENHRDDLLGIVLTHGHEDHLGALPYLWPRLKCPIYCSKFTAAVLRAKFNEHPSCRDAKIIETDCGTKVDLQPFAFEFIHVTHSIPDAMLTIIETKYGRVAHSGDWSIDPTPVIGKPTNTNALINAGDRGILAYIGDSTNAPKSATSGRSGSEHDLEDGLYQVFAKAEGRILVTMFSSNVGRIETIYKVAAKLGRKVCMLGRSLHRMLANAHDCGYLKNVHDFAKVEDFKYTPNNKILYLVTGSQGEANAALSRIARGEYKGVKLNTGDVAIFSSLLIPGNEKAVNAVKNNLSASGVKVIDNYNTKKIDISGHPYREDIENMLKWLRPQNVIPVHGESLMLNAQAEIAHSLGINNTIIPKNGAVICLNANPPAIIDHISTGVLAVEPNRIVPVNHKAIVERRKLQFSGAAHITIALNKRGELITEPQVTFMGLIDTADDNELDIIGDVVQIIEDSIAELKEDGITDNARIEEDIRVICRQELNNIFGFKPKVSVHLLRV